MARRPKVEPAKDVDQLAEAYRSCFASEAGQQVLNDLRLAYGRRSSFVPGDPQATAYNEGQRAVYLEIMAHIDPERLDQEETL